MSVHDPDFSVLPRLLPSKAFVVDVGAHRGQSIRSIKSLLPNATIHSFEINPEFHTLLRSVAAEYTGVTIHPIGLGAVPGIVKFFIPSADGIRYLEEVSMVREEYDKPWVKERWSQRGEMVIEEFSAPITTGDQFGFNPHLLKIDVEGAESEVIKGFRSTIEQHRPILFVENGDWPRVWPILEPMGYQPYMPNENNDALVPFAGVRVNTFYVNAIETTR